MDDDNDDNQTYFMEAAKEMMEDGVSCHDDGGRRLKAKDCLKQHIPHDSVGTSKLPAHDDLSLDTTEEEMSPNPTLNWRQRKKKANEKFMDAVTQALNGVVTSHGDLFSDSRVAQLLALVLWKYADGVCQEFVVTMAKEWL
jgi:hypothetical protein